MKAPDAKKDAIVAEFRSRHRSYEPRSAIFRVDDDQVQISFKETLGAPPTVSSSGPRNELMETRLGFVAGVETVA